MRNAKKIGLLCVAGIMITTPAYAYIDPNAGGLIFQILTPIFAMVAAALAFARRQISAGFVFVIEAAKNFFRRMFRISGRDLK